MCVFEGREGNVSKSASKLQMNSLGRAMGSASACVKCQELGFLLCISVSNTRYFVFVCSVNVHSVLSSSLFFNLM